MVEQQLTASRARRWRPGGTRVAVTAALMIGASVGAHVGSASAAVTWKVDATGRILTIKASAGEPLVVQCKNGVVRTVAGVVTTAACSTLTSLTLNGAELADTLDASLITAAEFPTLTTVVLNGKAGDDRLVGSQLADQIYGSTGNDRGIGNGGNDLIRGGDGDDRLAGGDGTDDVGGGDGNDSLAGARDDVSKSLDGVTDTLAGNAGSDTYVGSDSDYISNPVVDPGVDTVKWFFSWQPDVTTGNVLYADSIEVNAGEAANWSVGPAGDCGCTALRAKNIATGKKTGINHSNGSITLTMTSADEKFTADYSELVAGPTGDPYTIIGGAGTDALRIIAPDPALAVVTATTITYPGAITINYSGFESVKVFKSATPAAAQALAQG
jgi:hypothetical protein